MADDATLHNDLRSHRLSLGWSQEELARRAGVSRAGISAIETGRLVPSTAAALALAGALGCTVESLFRLSRFGLAWDPAEWAWPPGTATARYWCAVVGGRRRLYPVEVSALGVVPHDGIIQDGKIHDHPAADPERTIVLACCDPAVGLLAAELARANGFRLLVLPRNSRAALELLAQGLVHAAGLHLERSDQRGGNAAAVKRHLAAGTERDYRLLRLADWEEGIALAPSLGVDTIRSAVAAKLRWVAREPGSGAQQCLDEVLERTDSKRASKPPLMRAFDHRAVADAIRANWADAGICLRLASEEAKLAFLSVRVEAYEICMPEALAHDPRGEVLVQAVRSAEYRRMLSELPGYDTRRTGELSQVRVTAK
jgi:molybdate-binding protein/DNA-binding XRE family transcriptional regulator